MVLILFILLVFRWSWVAGGGCALVVGPLVGLILLSLIVFRWFSRAGGAEFAHFACFFADLGCLAGAAPSLWAPFVELILFIFFVFRWF